MNWYYALGDQRQGPVSDTELDALVAAGTVTENTLVWREGMANWAPLKEARPAASADVPAGWIRCTATGRYFPPEEIVYLDGKPYSAAAKPGVLQQVLQTGALPSSEAGRTGPPWENRSQLGFFPAAWQTISGVLTNPFGIFGTMRREGGLGSPLLFNILFGTVGELLSLLYNFLFNTTLQGLLPMTRQALALQAGINTAMVITFACLTPVFLILGSFIVSGVFHLSLMLCSGAKRPFETTYRTNCYAYGATALFQVLPFCGWFIAKIWWIVAVAIGVSRTHEISGGRAVLAVLLPVALCCLALFLSYGALIAFAISVSQAGHH